MKKLFYFISRHQPTPEQQKLAQKADIEIVHVGDRDAFKIATMEMATAVPGCNPDGYIVVHPAAALSLAETGKPVAVFENGNRSVPNEPPCFEPVALHIYQLFRRLTRDWDLTHREVRL